ncbi:cyclin-like protein interacting with PHO85 [Paramarasmius palmivorus]|uniref:Cyclin-like protein interacting with PHO85 n=1 Tax=Paramarasmius palmivorus TaxID=297713 RepID=A0AAW0DEV1_9AGAR
MLALAHPYDPSPEVSHRTPSSSSVSRQRHSRKSSSSSTSTSRQPSSSSAPSMVASSSSSSSSRSHTASHQHQSQPPPEPPRRQQQPVSDPSTSSASSDTAVEPSPPPPPIVNGGVFDIHSYPSADLLRLLASLLTQIAAANDKLDSSAASAALAESHSSFTPPSPSIEHGPFWRTLFAASRTALSTPSSTLTFHARNIPTITLEQYLLRILKYCPTTNEVFLSLLVYFDRMSKLCADATGRTFVIDSYNIHRLVIAGVTVASKFFSDVFYTNSRYAKVGGLPLAELNQLELQFLLLNDFRLVIPKDEMQRYAEQLILFSTSSSAPSISAGAVTPSSVAPPSAASLVRPPLAVQTQTHSTPAASTSSLTSASSFASSGSSTVVPNGGTPTNSTTSLQTSYNTAFSSSAQESSESQSSRMHAMGAIDAYGGRIPGASSGTMNKPPGPYSSFPSSTQSSDERGYSSYSHGVNGAVNGTMKTPRRASDASSVFSAYSEASSEADTETETETETDGGWTTDDEPTIRPHGGSVASGDSACGDSVYGGSDGKRGSVSSFDDQDEGAGIANSSSRRQNSGSVTGDESDDEREDGDASMEYDDDRGGAKVDVEMDVERTPDSERVWRRGNIGQSKVWHSG